MLHGHTGVINSVPEFSCDGQYVVTASDDRTVRIWDTQTYSQVGDALTGHTDAVWSACFSPDGTLVVSASADRTVRVWNAQSQAHEQVGESFTGHPDVQKASFLANGKQVISASWNIILFWDAVTHVQIAEPLHNRGLAFAISPDNNCIALRAEDDNACLEILNIQIGARIGERMEGHYGELLSVVFSPDGQRIVTSARYDRASRVWDANTGVLIDVIYGPGDAIHVSFFPDGRRIMIYTTYRFSRLTVFWDLKTHSQIRHDLSSKIDDLAYFSSLSPDGNQLASVSKDLHSIRIWSLEAPVNNSTSTDTFELNSASYSPDGKSITTACSDNTIRTWDAETYSQKGNPLIGHTDQVISAVFSPDRNLIVSASADETVRVWNAQTGSQIGEPLAGHRREVVSVAFSPDGTCFALTDGSTIRVWSAGHSDLGKLIWDVEIPDPKHRWPLLSMSFSSQRQFIAVNIRYRPYDPYSPHYNYVLDLKTGIESSVVPYKYRQDSVCFSPNEHLMLFFGQKGFWQEGHDLHLWNLETHCMEKVFSGHRSTVRRASFSFDGKHIVSSSMDHTIRVWDTKTGSQTAKYLNQGGYYAAGNLVTIEVSPDGRHILSHFEYIAAAAVNRHTQIWAMPNSLPSETNLDYSVDDPNVRP